MKISLKRILISLGVIILVALLCSTYTIERDVQKVCSSAVSRYGGAPVDAIMTMIDEEAGCSKDKSHALWALGQLGDKRALPFLKKTYGNAPTNDNCTYEAEFAITKIEEKRFNLPGFLWRGLLSGT